MTTATARAGPDRETVLGAIERVWGFRSLRPLQAEAIDAGLSRCDSLVVLPTGGGKSLCYQVPPLVAGRLDVVVSPLISLMKDQVDALQANGYPAGAVHSGLNQDERRDVARRTRSGELRLLLVAPERLASSSRTAPPEIEHLSRRWPKESRACSSFTTIGGARWSLPAYQAVWHQLYG